MILPARRARGIGRLARWLGPWTPSTAAPKGVTREVRSVGPSRVLVYRPPGRSEGALLVVHGVHFDGPFDPRFERFARVLAGSGLTIFAPEVRAYRALRADESAQIDVSAAAELTEREAARLGTRPAGFSISFGCLGLLRAVAAREGGRDWAGLLPFGGFADWAATIRFAYTGFLDDGEAAKNDALCRPVMAINLADEIPAAAADRERVRAAWRALVLRTWGDDDARDHGAWTRPAAAIADDLDGEERRLFELGVGIHPESAAAIETALSARDWSAFDPRPAASELRCPLYVAHGVGDDVIPVQEAPKLAAAATLSPDVRLYLTRWFGHTGAGGLGGDAGEELRTMFGFLDAIAGLPRTRG